MTSGVHLHCADLVIEQRAAGESLELERGAVIFRLRLLLDLDGSGVASIGEGAGDVVAACRTQRDCAVLRVDRSVGMSRAVDSHELPVKLAELGDCAGVERGKGLGVEASARQRERARIAGEVE